MSTDAQQAPAVEVTPQEAAWGRLDARMIVVRPLNEIVSFIPVLIVALTVGSHGTRLYWSLGAIALFMLRGLLHWLTTKYRITGEQVEVHHGLVQRQRLAMPRDRIRTVELTAKFGHRLFGLTAIRIGTGQHEQKRKGLLMLDAVPKAEAERLRKALLRRTTTTPSTSDSSTSDTVAVAAEEDQPGETLSALVPAWLRYAPLTLSGLAAVAALAGIVYRSFSELNIDPEQVGPLRDAVNWGSHASVWLLVAVAVLVMLVIVVIGSTIVYLFQFWNYRLTRETDGTLRVQRGLLTTRSVSLEERRLRGVAVRQPLLLRLGGGARLMAVATGLEKKTENHVLVPPAPLGEANRVAEAVLGEHPSPTLAPLIKHPASALRRRLTRALVPVLVIDALLLIGSLTDTLPSWIWRTWLISIPLAVLLGMDRYRNLGHTLTERYLVTRSGSLSRRTVSLQRNGIIGWKVSRSFFQRRAGVVTLTAVTAAGEGKYLVRDITDTAAASLANQAIPDLLTPFLTH